MRIIKERRDGHNEYDLIYWLEPHENCEGCSDIALLEFHEGHWRLYAESAEVVSSPDKIDHTLLPPSFRCYSCEREFDDQAELDEHNEEYVYIHERKKRQADEAFFEFIMAGGNKKD